jgi:iron complex outermembrane receptor protein
MPTIDLIKNFLTKALLICVVTGIILPLSQPAQASDETLVFNINKQSLAAALVEFATTSNSDYIAQGQLLSNKGSKAVTGTLSASKALSLMLENTGLIYKQLSDGTFLIKKKPADKTQDDNALEEVVISAPKRRTLNQSIPVSTSVFDGADLGQAGITNVRELTAVVQSLSHHGAINAAGQGMRLRGVGSGAIASGIEQSVSTIIDGVVAGPSGSGLQEMWDIERIEILRGPQGTLFGKNASAGAINFISKDPRDEFEAQLGARYEAQYQTTRLDGVISGALSDNTRARLAGYHTQQKEGTIDNIVRQETENIQDRYGLRAKVHFDQGSWWAKANIAYEKIDDSCCARVFSHIDNANASDTTNDWLPPAHARTGLVSGDENRTVITEGDLYERAKTLHSVFELGKEFNTGHKLKSISGYRRWQHSSFNDADNIDLDVVDVNDKRELKLFTQEIQLLSPINEHWDYIIGAYYYHQNFPTEEYISGGADFAGYSGTTKMDSTTKIENSALFGHANYHITDSTTLFGGLRVLHEKIEAVGQQPHEHGHECEGQEGQGLEADAPA